MTSPVRLMIAWLTFIVASAVWMESARAAEEVWDLPRAQSAWNRYRQEVARVASRLFGAEVAPEGVIGETLARATQQRELTEPDFVDALRARLAEDAPPPALDYPSFTTDPLAIWVESAFGLDLEPGSGRLVRARPRAIGGEDGGAAALAALTGVAVERCRGAIEQTLMAGYHCQKPEVGTPAFAFRLHQFFGRGETVFASLEPAAGRHLTVYGQQFVPGDRERVLLPLAFCRECGQEFFTVRRQEDPATGEVTFLPREVSDRFETDDGEPGFLFVDSGRQFLRHESLHCKNPAQCETALFC